MPDADIIRPLTTEEKKETIELGKRKRKTIHDIFREKLIDKQQTYVKSHRPFCARCAKIEFTDLIDTKMLEIQRKAGSANLDDIKIDIDFGDLDRYADFKRFRLHDKRAEQEINESKLVDGIRTTYMRGYFVNFLCKVRNCGISVEMSLSEYEIWKKEWDGEEDKSSSSNSTAKKNR